jgi:hypothetical protein
LLEIERDMFEGAHAAISLFDADGLQEQLCIVSCDCRLERRLRAGLPAPR